MCKTKLFLEIKCDKSRQEIFRMENRWSKQQAASFEQNEKSKKKALKKANLDQLLTMEKLAGILKAENFSMPAGYISEDGTQYLIKVGDEYSSMDAMKDTVLCKLDGIGDIRLKDVAKVTKIDDSSFPFTRP